MKTKGIKGLILPLLLLAVFLIYGCSGDDDNVTGGGGTNNPDTLALELSQALQDMIETMSDDPNAQLDDFNFVGLNQAFREYEARHPGDETASFGAAITSLLMLTASEDLNALIDTLDAMDGGVLKLHISNPEKVSGERNLLSFPTEISGAGVERNFLAQSYMALMARAISNPPQISEVQAIVRDEFIPAVQDAIGYLDKVLANPGYIFWVTPEMMGETSDSVEIDYVDFLVFGSGLRVIESFFHMAVAYNVDVPSYDTAGVAYMFNPENHWMSLHPDGGDHLAAAYLTFGEAVSMADAAVTALQAEQSSDLNQSNDLIKAEWSASEYNDAHLAIDSVNSYMNGPQTVMVDLDDDGFDEPLTVDASKIFTDPIDGVFDLVPPYTSEVAPKADTAWNYYYYWNGNEYILDSSLAFIRAYFVVNITWEANTFGQWIFPNPSVNGLFPEITTDAALKAFLGLTAEDWSKVMQIKLPG